MTRRTLQRVVIFWLFVVVSAYLVYIYPIQRLTNWLGRPDLLTVPIAVGFWILMIVVPVSYTHLTLPTTPYV